MHRGAVLEQDELPLARELGLAVLERKSRKLRFALPCSRLVGNRCGVYDRRPHACRTYECKLLKRLLVGERTLEQGLETVRHAHELITEVRNSIDAQREKRDFWQELKEWAEQNPERSATARLDAAELLVLLRREFLLSSDEPVE